MRCLKCGAALVSGSRFCNTCGSAVAPPPGGALGHAARPVAPVGSGSGKPVWLLATILTLVAAGVVGAGVMMAKRLRPAVTSAQQPGTPTGPGVQAAGGVGMPNGPGVTGSTGSTLPPGPNTVGSTQKPDDGMAPPLTVSQNYGGPQGPSVVTSQSGPSTPMGPNPLGATGGNAPPAPPVTGGTPPPAPRPPDNADFDRYVRWLRYVETERSGLRAEGETESFRVIDSFYQTMLGLSDPDANDIQMQQQFDNRIRQSLQRTVQAIRIFGNNISRTKPPVPSDCRALDAHYLRAVTLEAEQTAGLLDALARKDIGRVRSIGKSGVGSIDTSLGMANRELEKVYQGRGLNQQFRIETGGNSSMLGGMIGLGGVR